jgi:hypothetical protein
VVYVRVCNIIKVAKTNADESNLFNNDGGIPR